MSSQRRQLGWVRQAIQWANRVEEWLVILLLVAMVGVVALQVFMRYVLNDPLLWSEIAARLIFTWLTFLGAAVAFRYNIHIQIDVLVNLLPLRARSLVQLTARAITVALLLLLIVKGFSYVRVAWPQRVAPYEFSYGLFALAIPVSAMLMLVHVVFARRSRPAGDPLSGGPGQDEG